MSILLEDPVRLDPPAPRDPAEAEFWRRLLDHGPGSITRPIQTVDQIREEFRARDERSDHALALTKAGFGKLAVAWLVSVSVGAVESAEKAAQPFQESAEAEGFRPLDEADSDAENADFEIKEITWARKPAFVEKTEAYPDPEGEEASISPSLVTGPLKTPTLSARKRRHKNDVPWHEKHFVEGHKVSKTLSVAERKWIDGAVLRWKVLKGKTEQIVCLTIKPSHLDDLGPVERMEYWEPLVNRVRSYRNSRCTVLGKPHSSWEVRAVGVRESNQDHLGEHCHTAFSFPNREEAELFIAHVQDPANSKTWGDNVHAMRISTRETMVGGKLSSFFNYMLKAANPQSRFADHTIGWQPSGALVGKRYFITENLTDPDVIEETAVGVARLKEIREEKKLAALRRRAREKAKEGRLYRYDAAPTPAPADPVLAPAVVEPEPIEPAIYSASASAGPVHHEAERRDMDLVEIETRPAVPAAIEPVLAPHEPAAVMVPAAIEAHAEAVELLAAIAPATAPPAPPVFITETATPLTATADRTALVMLASSPATSASSSPKAVLVALAGVGRSVARTAMVGAGWISSRLGPRSPPPHTPQTTTSPTPARRPRAPLSLASASSLAASFIAAGAFLGAPDIRGGPWA